MDIINSMAIGLYPLINQDKFVEFGNGALAGARDNPGCPLANKLGFGTVLTKE